MIISDVFMTYIVPVLVVVAIAGVLAFALAFLGEKLAVRRDERIDQIKSLLSGANCGGCGYAGCDAFAEAVFKGEASLDSCKPTSNENKQKIARLMGVEIKESEPVVAVVHCNGGFRCKNKGGYQGYGDCLSVNMLAGGNKACEVGCMGMGTCSQVCGYHAVTVDKTTGVSVVDPEKCVACGACVMACPDDLIGIIPKKAAVYIACSNPHKGKDITSVCEVGCIACGICQKVCPTGAVVLKNNVPVFDYDKCTGCGLCAEKCPRKCILKRF